MNKKNESCSGQFFGEGIIKQLKNLIKEEKKKSAPKIKGGAGACTGFGGDFLGQGKQLPEE